MKCPHCGFPRMRKPGRYYPRKVPNVRIQYHRCPDCKTRVQERSRYTVVFRPGVKV